MQRDPLMPGRRALIEGGIGLALTALAFSAIAGSDVSVAGTRFRKGRARGASDKT